MHMGSQFGIAKGPTTVITAAVGEPPGWPCLLKVRSGGRGRSVHARTESCRDEFQFCILRRRARKASRCNFMFLLRLRRHSGLIKRVRLMPVGTTSNESLHQEINLAFRQTRTIHKSTLRMKLDAFALRKALPHVEALCRPTTKQMSFRLCLARSLASWRFDTKAVALFASYLEFMV